jgi:hypothetical protein
MHKIVMGKEVLLCPMINSSALLFILILKQVGNNILPYLLFYLASI